MTRWVATLFDRWCSVVVWAGTLGAYVWGVWLVSSANPAGFTLLFLGSVMLVLLVGYRRQKT